MPISDKDLGKYKRPGIFFNRIDKSAIELPVQNVLVNLVLGFSKKGPFNTNVYVSTPAEFISIFGNIDRNLENKGSYFHRTALKMLESGPIWVINLLSTDDNRDKINWRSLSCAASYDNDITRKMPYSRVFNKQGFWKRDDEAFLTYVNNATSNRDRLLHITNVGNDTITVFIYKSNIEGFDVSLEDWYGGVDKVPSYLHPKDLVSDFLVSVLVLSGDWTDYNSLSSDIVWSNYFNSKGLIKTKIQDFVNEPNVNVLFYSDCSLIPYFKDIEGRDMYIKSVINNNSDKIGLFCAYNDELIMNSDFPLGKIDIIGDGLVNNEKRNINFLSYNTQIVDKIEYKEKYLDSSNNVFGNYSSKLSDPLFLSLNSRTASNTSWYVEGVSNINTTNSSNSLYRINGATYDNNTSMSYFYIDSSSSIDFNDPTVKLYQSDLNNGDIVYFNKDFNGVLKNKPYYIIDSNSNDGYYAISETPNGPAVIFCTATTCAVPSDFYLQKANVKFQINNGAYFNLNGVKYSLNSSTNPIVISLDSLEIQNTNTIKNNKRVDVLYLTENSNKINILKGTQTTNGSVLLPDFIFDYNNNIILGYVLIEVDEFDVSSFDPVYENIKYYLKTTYYPITVDHNGYIPLTGVTISSVTFNNNNYVELIFSNTSGSNSYKDYNKLRYRAAFKEIVQKLVNNKGVIIDKNGKKYPINNIISTTYSTQYDARIRINVGSNNVDDFILSNNVSENYKWLIYYVDDEFLMQVNGTNILKYTQLPIENTTLVNDKIGVIGRYSNIYLDYYNGIINNMDYFYKLNDETNDKIYVKMWFDNTILYVEFYEDEVTSYTIQDWNDYNNKIVIYSNSSNYKQTIEIEALDVAKLPNLVYEIKIDKFRYSEVVKNVYLEAYYDKTLYEPNGPLYGKDPRKLTRIVSVLPDPFNPNLKIIKTDAPIKIDIIEKNGETYYQTTMYTEIEKYVTEYKGIKLEGFKIHQDSLPDGTEERLNQILNVVAKDTNLAKAIANKNLIQWRYLVDSFGLGLTENSKQQLADLCGMKRNCFGFINAPSAKMFKNSSNPSFVNDDGTLNVKFIKAGGDESKNPVFLYSFAKGVGRSNVGYFFPYVTIDDNNIPKDVPPAAYVATTYMKKFTENAGSIEPWAVCAGINNGRIEGIIKTEMDFTDEDLEVFYQMNLNPIVKIRDVGYCINSEFTAQVFPYSSLSLIHAIEVLIELENSLYDMLLRFQWLENTPEIRSQIKYRADKICRELQSRGALYDFANVINETNNTDYIIDLQMGVLDTYVEIIKNMGIIVNNMIIMRKGGIQSSGFAQQ